MSDICPPLRVTFTTGALPDATITVNRAEGDPIYWLEFVSTSETVKPMPVDDRPQDRVTEISVGLPTLLNIAGAVLGRDLIEEEVEDDRRYADQIAALLRGSFPSHQRNKGNSHPGASL